MLALPTPATNVVRLADWVELCAVISPDHNYSIGDLERALKSSGVLKPTEDSEQDPEAGVEAVPEICTEVYRELETRTVGAGPAYPFQLQPAGVLELAVNIEEFSPYMFCLCLSYWPVARVRGMRVFPDRLFERLSAEAARNYIGGESVRFAFPRDELPPGFGRALEVVCARLGEGRVRERTGRPGDAKLDVVAWRHFPDKSPGKLVLFGQCASGADWEGKLGELQPDAFCGSWLSVAPASKIVKAFFIPHRMDRDDWEDATRQGGLVFERCRLSYWVNNGGFHGDPVPFVGWYRQRLRAVAA